MSHDKLGGSVVLKTTLSLGSTSCSGSCGFFSFGVLTCPMQLVDTTVEIANKVAGAEIVSRIVEDLKDENEQYRKMVMDCIEKVRIITL